MRLTTVRIHRPDRTGGSSAGFAVRSGARAAAPVAAFAAAAVVLGLAVSASPAAATPAAASSDVVASGEGVRAAGGPTAQAESAEGGSTTAQAQPVAVAVIEQPDGSLTVETHETGSVAAAAIVADQLGKQPRVVASGVDHEVHALVSPSDDPLYKCQWALLSANSICPSWYYSGNGSIPLAPRSLKAASVWPQATGAGITIAVVDSGVWAAHPDLSGKVASGYDVFSPAKKGKFDGFGHGTHVAGIVAAKDNAIGVVGLAPGATILPVRVLNSLGSGTDSTVAEGIVWAVDHGADVINLSLGGRYASSVQAAAVNYAQSKGVVVVASAGNSGADGNPTLYPAAFPGVIAVGSTDHDGRVSSFSERKSYLGIAAPGDEIASTCFDTSSSDPQAPDVCRYTVDGDPNYAWLTGTSMAAPYVSATAALLLQKKGNLSAAAVGAYLTGSAIAAGSPGRDSAYGFGHLNPKGALDRLGAARPTSLSVRPNASSVVANTRITLSATFASNGWRLARRPVEFQKYFNGSWTKIATVNTSGSGVATYSTPVGVHTKFRAVAHATPGLAQAIAASTTVAVKAKVLISGSSPSADRVTITAKISPAAAVKASLQRKKDGVWTTISSKTLSSTGTTTFSNVSAPTGTRTFRVVVASSTIAHGGISSPLTLNVK